MSDQTSRTSKAGEILTLTECQIIFSWDSFEDNDGYGPFIFSRGCPDCENELDTQQDPQQHFRVQLICPTCGSTFRSSRNVNSETQKYDVIRVTDANPKGIRII